MKEVMIRYGELGLKSRRVKRRFLERLTRNIFDTLQNNGESPFITKDSGRLYVFVKDLRKGLKLLKNVFGIVSISPIVKECKSNLVDISDCVVNLSFEHLKTCESFAISTRRIGEHPFTSQEVSSFLGEKILKENKDKEVFVDLKNPDKTIFVEIRGNITRIFTEKIDAVGGLPYKTQGKVATLICGKNSVLSSWLLAKRGCEIIPVFTKKREEIKENLDILKRWIYDIEPEKIESEKLLNLVKFARETKCSAVVVGWEREKIEREFKERKSKLNFPIFFPLIGLKVKDIKALKKIVFYFDGKPFII